MKSDRELLELAAKAAGIELHWSTSGIPEVYCEDYENRFPWNPLANDGDCLRLLIVMLAEHGPEVARRIGYEVSRLKCPGDIFAANRLAIVRAVAFHGDAMP